MVVILTVQAPFGKKVVQKSLKKYLAHLNSIIMINFSEIINFYTI